MALNYLKNFAFFIYYYFFLLNKNFYFLYIFWNVLGFFFVGLQKTHAQSDGWPERGECGSKNEK